MPYSYSPIPFTNQGPFSAIQQSRLHPENKSHLETKTLQKKHKKREFLPVDAENTLCTRIHGAFCYSHYYEACIPPLSSADLELANVLAVLKIT